MLSVRFSLRTHMKTHIIVAKDFLTKHTRIYTRSPAAVIFLVLQSTVQKQQTEPLNS